MKLEVPARNLQIFSLTQPGAFGYSFNPVSFYFCFQRRHLVALLTEVTNIPSVDRHWYPLRVAGERARGALVRVWFDKALHVSPFLNILGACSLFLVWNVGDEQVVCHYLFSLRHTGGTLSERCQRSTR